jgi:hypothetical protein
MSCPLSAFERPKSNRKTHGGDKPHSTKPDDRKIGQLRIVV